jgi:hypothetical protein
MVICIAVFLVVKRPEIAGRVLRVAQRLVVVSNARRSRGLPIATKILLGGGLFLPFDR